LQKENPELAQVELEKAEKLRVQVPDFNFQACWSINLLLWKKQVCV
jgi:hypothetical protein